MSQLARSSVSKWGHEHLWWGGVLAPGAEPDPECTDKGQAAACANAKDSDSTSTCSQADTLPSKCDHSHFQGRKRPGYHPD